MIGTHQKAILQFSGGKDSTALLMMARPWLHMIDVLFVDTGATFPHVMRFIRETCDAVGARLVIVRPDVPVQSYIDIAGYPSDIVPVEADGEFAPYLKTKPEVTLQPYSRCCAAMIWAPMQKAVEASGATLVLRGSKAADGRRGVSHGHVENGIEYASPLWDWSDSDVLGYLADEGVKLPAHYGTVNESLDCTICTAHMAHNGADKLRFMRSDYPDLARDVTRRLGAIRNAVSRALSSINCALEIGGSV